MIPLFQSRNRSFGALAVCVAVCVAALSGGALAQTNTIPDDEPAPDPIVQGAGQNPTMTFNELYQSIGTMDENRRAGLRASLLSQAMQTLPIVVIVDDLSMYIDAISAWEGPIKFPVLYDDGTTAAKEHIARFVRRYNPERVHRIEGKGKRAWGGSAENRQGMINTALAAAIHEPEADWKVTLKALKDTGIVSPGVVVIDPKHRHWAAGLALAAGRLQPIIYFSSLEKPFDNVEPTMARSVNLGIEQGLRRLGLEFDEIGDEVDVITLAFGIGVKIRTGPGDRAFLATTDQIGRTESSIGGLRWAWCGQFRGTTSTTIYQAMCSLFLPIDSAYIWDGYSSTGDWDRYDGTAASNVLEQAGFETELFDSPRNSLAGFKGRSSSRPVDSSLILMNSKGSHVYFDLPQAREGSGRPGDLPILGQPSVLHMVHSFSLATPRSSRTVGGRWLERGVYLYAGSVNEPFLSGFVPTPFVAQRLLARMPFAAAVHYDDGQAWKITVLGDPLKTVSPCGTRLSEVPAPIRESLGLTEIGLEDRAKSRLKESSFSSAIEDFVLAGNDEAVVRLGAAILRDRPESIEDDATKLLLQAAFRQHEHELVLDAFERLSVEERTDRMIMDTMWLAGRYRLTRFQDSRAMAIMSTHLREWQEVHDAEELAVIMKSDSREKAIRFMESLRAKISGSSDVRALNAAIKRISQ
jgi:hypothetical protein